MTHGPESAEGDNRSCVATDILALNGSKEDHSATDSFVQQAMTIIMDEVVKKAGDARGKVRKSLSSLFMLFTCFVEYCR